MDITKLGALTHGYFPVPRSGQPRSVAGADARETALTTARRTQQPVEYVVQGELLQKRRITATGDGFELLSALRDLERSWRYDGAETDGAASRDTRRAIDAYTREQAAPTTRAASAAAQFIDYYV